MQIDFTKEEAQALIGLLDTATKAGGLNVAQNALSLAVKIQKAINMPETVKEEPKEDVKPE